MDFTLVGFSSGSFGKRISKRFEVAKMFVFIYILALYIGKIRSSVERAEKITFD